MGLPLRARQDYEDEGGREVNANDQLRLVKIEANCKESPTTYSRDVLWVIEQLKAAQNPWQDIATLPPNVIFMRLAFGPEDDQSTCDGIQWDGKFYAACVYYCLGKERPYKLEEKEVHPTHWQPLPQPPKI